MLEYLIYIFLGGIGWIYFISPLEDALHLLKDYAYKNNEDCNVKLAKKAEYRIGLLISVFTIVIVYLLKFR